MTALHAFVSLVLFLAPLRAQGYPPPRVTPVRSPAAANPNYPQRAASLGAFKALR